MSGAPDRAPAVEIDLELRSPLWRQALPEAERLAETAARAALAGCGRTIEAPARSNVRPRRARSPCSDMTSHATRRSTMPSKSN